MNERMKLFPLIKCTFCIMKNAATQNFNSFNAGYLKLSNCGSKRSTDSRIPLPLKV